MPPPTATHPGAETTFNAGTVTDWENVSVGAFVDTTFGYLYRVPEDAVKVGRSPLIEIIGKQPLKLIQISTDPFIPINKARMVCASLDVAPAF